MRTSLLLCTLSLLASITVTAQAPRLWGMTPGGGPLNKGTLFHVDADGTDFVDAYDFDDASGWGPEGSLCLASNGKLYGCTTLGGTASPAAGTLFSFDPNGTGFHKIIDFDITNGGFNWGGMITGADGSLYGAAYGGGSSGGSIFTVDPSNDAYTIVHGLDDATEGGAVNNRLMLASDGWMYGAASTGGTFDAGTLFRFDPVSHAFNTLHHFDGADGGATPYGALCEAANGWFYGTTFSGGANSSGILFKYEPTGNTFVKLADLDTIPASNSWNSLVSVGPDLLIGTMTSGGQFGSGFIYSVVPSTDAFSEIFSFNSLNGGTLFGSQILGSDGLLYGMCGSGGTNFLGTVYSFDPASHAMNIVHSFAMATDGASPRGDLTQAGTAVGIDEADVPPLFDLYPNPTTGTLNLAWADVNAPTAQLTITDALGQVVRSEVLRRSPGTIHLNTAPGVYWMTLDVSGVRSARRFILY